MQKFLLGFLLLTASAVAQESALDAFLKRTKISAELNTYYAYDIGTSQQIDNNERVLSGTSAFNNEFRINLFKFDLAHHTEDYRFVTELRFGDVPLLLTPVEKQATRYIANTYAGVRVSRTMWVDFGIMNHPAGFEGTDFPNWLATLSVPGYCEPGSMVGIRATHALSEKLTLQYALYNSYNIISSNNTNKSVGWALDYQPTATLHLNLNNSFGDEGGKNQPGLYQSFYNLYAIWNVTPWLDLIGECDFASQANSKRSDSTKAAFFNSAVLAARWRVMDNLHLIAMAELMNDPDGFITNNAGGSVNKLHTRGATVGFRYLPTANSYLRVEYQFLEADQPIFIKGLDHRGSVVVTAGMKLEN